VSEFGKLIRSYRKKSCYTSSQVAECIGGSKSMLLAYEKGSVVPNLLVALKLAKLFGFSIDALDPGELKPLSQAAPNRRQLSVVRKIKKREAEIEKLKESLE
jgi:DNA-binding XRE family transcriptional regulator